MYLVIKNGGNSSCLIFIVKRWTYFWPWWSNVPIYSTWPSGSLTVRYYYFISHRPGYTFNKLCPLIKSNFKSIWMISASSLQKNIFLFYSDIEHVRYFWILGLEISQCKEAKPPQNWMLQPFHVNCVLLLCLTTVKYNNCIYYFNC